MARRMPRTNAKRCTQLVDLLSNAETMLILLQDSPDPDALAAAAALRFIANSLCDVGCTIAHGGVVGRAENAALARYLQLNPRPFSDVTRDKFDLVALVDTQPGTGNNVLPCEHVPDIVIDHHPVRRLTRSSPYTDIRRRYGATSTILFEYLQTLELEPDRPVATGLLYGIRSDTQDLGREACQADIHAHLKLYPLANQRILARIQNASVSRDYFRALADGLRSAVVAGKGIFCPLVNPGEAEMVSEIADLLLRYDGCSWVLVCGLDPEGHRLLLSLRGQQDGDDEAGKVIRRIIGAHGSGGGHGSMAGGQIALTGKNAEEIMKDMERRFFRFVAGKKSEPGPLIDYAGNRCE